MFISLILTPDFISKSCEKSIDDLDAFTKLILYEDPYIIIFKHPSYSRDNLFKKAKISGSKHALWLRIIKKLLDEKRLYEINEDVLKIAKANKEDEFIEDPVEFYKVKSLKNKIFSSSTLHHPENDRLHKIEILGETNQIQEYKIKKLIKENCRLSSFSDNEMGRDLFIEKLGAYTLFFDTLIIFDQYMIKPYIDNETKELDGEAVFEISKFIAASNLKKIILITAEGWEFKKQEKNKTLMTNKSECIKLYKKKINELLSIHGKEIKCEIILMPSHLCRLKHFRTILFLNFKTKKRFELYDLTRKNGASFIPIQLDNGCNYFRKNNKNRTYQFRYLYKEDMWDFFESIGESSIHKLPEETKDYWYHHYREGRPWFNTEKLLSEI